MFFVGFVCSCCPAVLHSLVFIQSLGGMMASLSPSSFVVLTSVNVFSDLGWEVASFFYQDVPRISDSCFWLYLSFMKDWCLGCPFSFTNILVKIEFVRQLMVNGSAILGFFSSSAVNSVSYPVNHLDLLWLTHSWFPFKVNNDASLLFILI